MEGVPAGKGAFTVGALVTGYRAGYSATCARAASVDSSAESPSALLVELRKLAKARLT